MLRTIFSKFRKLYLILTRAQIIYGLLILFAALVAALFETLGVSIIIPLTNAILNPYELENKPYIMWTMNELGIKSETQIAIFIVGITVMLYLLKNAYFVFFSWLKYKYSCKVQRECSMFMMASYLSRGYSFFLHTSFSEVVEGIRGDVNRLFVVITGLIQIVTQMLICIFIGVFMLISDWQMTLSLFCVISSCFVLIITVYRKIMANAGHGMRQYGILENNSVYECFQGIKETFVFRKQQFFLSQFLDNTIKKHNAEVVYNVGLETPAYIIEGMCITIIMCVLGLRITQLEDSSAFVATLASFAVGAFRILPALGKISSSANSVFAVSLSVDNVYENVVEARQQNDSHYALERDDNPKYLNHKFTHFLEGKNLSFSYGAGLDNVIENISIQIPKGKAVALVGESGAGKTTLADILLGVLPPTEGQVLLDGVDISEIPNYWSSIISFVPQSIYLFDKTIFENVAFGELEENIDMEKVRNALAKANLMDFVESLPNGLYTRVGDGGVLLSGGQKQRIGIARALYRDPEIMVLDEATSALDSETENSVMEAINMLQGQMTLIVIAHRISTIRNCDYIYEIRHGKAIERKYSDLDEKYLKAMKG